MDVNEAIAIAKRDYETHRMVETAVTPFDEALWTLAAEVERCHRAIREIWSLRFIPDGAKSREAEVYGSLDGEQVTPATMETIRAAQAAGD